MSVELSVVDDPARECAALMVDAARAGGHIVLSGGSTPRAANEHFVQAVLGGEGRLDLARTTFWFGDERCVAPDDERSNYRMAVESLLDPLSDLATTTVHRMRGELGPFDGADDYERALRDAGDPRFDLLLLGIGPDGHTLSLFGGQATLRERSRPVVGVPEAGFEPFVPRISMTLSAVGRARRVVVLAAGAGKAAAIGAAFGRDAQPDPAVPPSLLAPEAGAVTVLVDPAAGSRLPGRG